MQICLGEVISLSQRHISTKFVLERIFDPIFCEISVPETFPSNLAESIDELPDKVALVLGKEIKIPKKEVFPNWDFLFFLFGLFTHCSIF